MVVLENLSYPSGALNFRSQIFMDGELFHRSRPPSDYERRSLGRTKKTVTEQRVSDIVNQGAQLLPSIPSPS